MVTRGVVGANEASASGLGGSRSVWVPHVIIAHSLEVARACEQDVAESAVGACVDALELEGYVRIATRARHANLLCLFRRRFPSLACLVAGVSSAVAGPLLENVTCSSPSLTLFDTGQAPRVLAVFEPIILNFIRSKFFLIICSCSNLCISFVLQIYLFLKCLMNLYIGI